MRRAVLPAQRWHAADAAAGAVAAVQGMHYVQAQMAALETRPAALADGSDADAADAADAADGGEGEGEGGMVRSGSAALLTDYARSALGGVRALDEKYGVTRRAGELAVAASCACPRLPRRTACPFVTPSRRSQGAGAGPAAGRERARQGAG